MLMAAATHMAGPAHSSSSSSISPPPMPPWHPGVVLVPNHQHHQALYNLDLIITPSPSPATPPTPQRLRPAARRAGKQRRPRPSRKLPTTYISADAASFRRMVHQVTGADDVVVHQATAAAAELLCRPPGPPSRAAALAATTATTLVLPTLDTSAFLLGAGRGGDYGGRTPPLARPAGASGCHGSAVAVGDPGAALQAEVACGGGGGGGGVRGGRGGEYSCSSNGRRQVPELGVVGRRRFLPGRGVGGVSMHASSIHFRSTDSSTRSNVID